MRTALVPGSKFPRWDLHVFSAAPAFGQFQKHARSLKKTLQQIPETEV